MPANAKLSKEQREVRHAYVTTDDEVRISELFMNLMDKGGLRPGYRYAVKREMDGTTEIFRWSSETPDGRRHDSIIRKWTESLADYLKRTGSQPITDPGNRTFTPGDIAFSDQLIAAHERFDLGNINFTFKVFDDPVDGSEVHVITNQKIDQIRMTITLTEVTSRRREPPFYGRLRHPFDEDGNVKVTA